MKKTRLLLALLIALSIGQVSGQNSDIVDLAKIYRNFMFSNSPTQSTFKQLNTIQNEENEVIVNFIKETITSRNALTNKEFLTIPSEDDLLQLYTIRRVNWNLREETPRDNAELIAELQDGHLTRYELIDSYYDMLFTGIGNKNRPFDLSNVNFELFDYQLADDTEKGIFFLKAMDLCGTTIWGYMNIVKPPNYKLALEHIDKYPTFSGQPYYQYLDFGFPDFELVIEKDKGKESYKSYYINKYYDTLLYHLACLSQKKKHKEAKQDLALGSILRESNYYKYSKNRKTLESIFTTIER